MKRHAVNHFQLETSNPVIPSLSRNLWLPKGVTFGIERRSMGRGASPAGVPTQRMGTSFQVEEGNIRGVNVSDRRYSPSSNTGSRLFSWVSSGISQVFGITGAPDHITAGA